MSLEEVEDHAFDLAFAWRMSPKDVFELTPSDLALYARQYNRIQERNNDGR